MAHQTLTIHTGTPDHSVAPANPQSIKGLSTMTTDAQTIANAIRPVLRQAATNAVSTVQADSASLRDAQLREEVAKVYGSVVANGLAGEALAELAKQCRKQGAPAANSKDKPRFDEVPY